MFEDDLRSHGGDALELLGHRALCLMDLLLPCNMRCRGCAGMSAGAALLTDEAMDALVESVMARVAAERAEYLDLALFGGEPLLDLEAVLSLSSAIQGACAARGVGYAGHLITNGTLLANVAPERLAASGLTRVQVTLEGGRRTHDSRRRMLDGGGSLERIVAGLRRARGSVSLLVRAHAEALTPEVENILCGLDADGLLDGHPDVALFVASPAPYAEQARDLVRIFPLLEASAQIGFARA